MKSLCTQFSLFPYRKVWDTPGRGRKHCSNCGKYCACRLRICPSCNHIFEFRTKKSKKQKRDPGAENKRRLLKKISEPGKELLARLPEMRPCDECGELIELINYPVMVWHPKSLLPIWRGFCCRCWEMITNDRKNLKEIYGNPALDYSCPICVSNTQDKLISYPKRHLHSDPHAACWCIDHDHKTRGFRGHLCLECNRGIGILGDNIGTLVRAMEYLEIHTKDTPDRVRPERRRDLELKNRKALLERISKEGEKLLAKLPNAKPCDECGEWIDIINYPRMVWRTNSLLPIWRSVCPSCQSIIESDRRRLKRIHGKPPLDHCCPICLQNSTQKLIRYPKRIDDPSACWSLDHDHKTGMFRDWLCLECNKGTGILRDNIDNVKRAIRYLEGDSMRLFGIA